MLSFSKFDRHFCVLKNFVEEWEKKCLKKRSQTSEMMLKRKYAGLMTYKVDSNTMDHYRISDRTIAWSNKKDFKCYLVVIYHQDVDESTEPENCSYLPINDELHWAIRRVTLTTN